MLTVLGSMARGFLASVGTMLSELALLLSGYVQQLGTMLGSALVLALRRELAKFELAV